MIWTLEKGDVLLSAEYVSRHAKTSVSVLGMKARVVLFSLNYACDVFAALNINHFVFENVKEIYVT